MANLALFRDLLRAAALGDFDTAATLDERIPDADRDAFTLHVTALFAAAVAHQFNTDRSHPAILAFVNAMRDEYRDAEPPLKPLALEGLIRAVLGEEHLMDEISPAVQLRYSLLVIHAVATDSESMRAELDGYLDAAARVAADWIRAVR